MDGDVWGIVWSGSTPEYQTMNVLSLKTNPGEIRYQLVHNTNYEFQQRGYNIIDITRDELREGKYDDLLNDRENSLVFGSVYSFS